MKIGSGWLFFGRIGEGLEDRVLSDEQLLLRLANYCFLRSLSRLLLLLPRNGVDIALIETIRL